MKMESTEEVKRCFIDEMTHRDGASISKIVEMAGTVHFALALKTDAARPHVMELLPEVKAHEIENLIEYFGPIRMIDGIDAMKEIINAARILDRLAGGRAEKLETPPAIDERKSIRTYQFIRRFLNLDIDNRTFTAARDEKYEIVHNDIDSAKKQFIALLDEREGTDGVIYYWRGGADETWVGFYVDEKLRYPQLVSMDRMHWDGGKTFDYIFYPEEGRYNGEYNKYLFLGDSVFKRGFDLE